MRSSASPLPNPSRSIEVPGHVSATRSRAMVSPPTPTRATAAATERDEGRRPRRAARRQRSMTGAMVGSKAPLEAAREAARHPENPRELGRPQARRLAREPVQATERALGIVPAHEPLAPRRDVEGGTDVARASAGPTRRDIDRKQRAHARAHVRLHAGPAQPQVPRRAEHRDGLLDGPPRRLDGQRGPRDVLDVPVRQEQRRRRLARVLLEEAALLDVAAVGLAIGEHGHVAHRGVRIDGHREG